MNSSSALEESEIVDEIHIKGETFEYKLNVKVFLRTEEDFSSNNALSEKITVIAYPSKPGRGEYSLHETEDIEKELNYFKNKCKETEEENFILVEKIREFERKIESLSEG